MLIEIGFGSGDFLLELAQKRPHANLLGVEISLPSLRRGQRKMEQAGLNNVHLVQGSAELILWALCRPATVSGLYVNFPDPWPKPRHHHRRLIDDRFLHLAATRLLPGSPLEIATDHAEYAGAIAERLLHTPYFDSGLDMPFVTEDNERSSTKYEMKALAEGRTCHYFKWQRNSVPATNDFPVPEELPMPHVVLRSPLSLDEIGRRFAPSHISEGTTHVNLLELYQSSQDGKLLIEAYVKEEPMTQRVGLVIRPRREGGLVVGLHEVGFPRPTPGIQLAIRHLAEWLKNLHPETQIVHRNV